MWEKRRTDSQIPETAPAPQRTPPAPSYAPSPATAPPPVRVAEPAGFRGTAISSSLRIVGDIYSEEDIYVDGEVRGKLDVKDGRLTVGPNGKAQSDVKAREVVILGKVQGDVEAAQKITIRSTGSLVGNIKTTGIVIDDDAYFKGSIEIVHKTKESAA